MGMDLWKIQTEQRKPNTNLDLKLFVKRHLSEYEKELAKSSDSVQCDDVDWPVLCSEMIDVLTIVYDKL